MDNNYEGIEVRESAIEEKTVYSVTVPDEVVNKVGDKIYDLVLQKVVERYVEENYENIVYNMDIPEMAEAVSKMVKNKIAVDVMQKELQYISNDSATKEAAKTILNENG